MVMDEANPIPRFERFTFATAVIFGFSLLLVVSVAPQNTRALFLKDEGKLSAKAFTAVVPALDAASSQAEFSLLNAASRLRTSRSSPRLTNAPGSSGGATNPSLLPDTVLSLLSSGAGPAGSVGSGAPFGGPGAGPFGRGLTSTPGGQQSSGPSGNGPAAPGLPGPTAGAPGTQVEVPAVPEPTTWTMMLLGFFAIGTAMRRRNAPSPEGAPARS